ncbi:unnamed protein product [Psylliodes chrysocephalus]|uniref:Cilia- and flagella-associated protein 69 ARM repeats domain-containing protein n=1 Tax=Psylliodes chrysocephalus TaxID=3402493 RepID=A0A9P0GBU8_9CUCU|nr:unnamed protein product [Psylliodes chrysocephala]
MNMENVACTCSNASNLLNRIVALLECEITKHDISRILEMLYNFISASQCGIYVSDLVAIMRLLEIACDRFKEVPTFKDILKNVLNICKIPPFMKVCSDVLRYAPDIKEFFAVLGYLLLLIEDVDIQNIVMDTIMSLLETPAYYKSQVPLEVRRKEAAAGRLPGLLGQALFLLNDELFKNLLLLTLNFAINCPHACKDLAFNDALNALFVRMEGTWRSRYPNIHPNMTKKPEINHLNSILALANVILAELSKKREIIVDVPVITRFSLWNIKYLFHYVGLIIRWGFARNNLFTCVMCMMDLFQNIDFITSGLGEGLLIDGHIICLNSIDLIKKPYNIETEESYYFLKVFLFCLPLYLRFSNGIFVLERCRIVTKTLSILTRRSIIMNPNEHTSVVKILAFKVFNKIVPRLEEEFIENSGPVVMLTVLKSVDSSPMGLAIALNCLDTIRCVVKNDTSKCVSNSIIFNHGDDTLLDVCKEFLKIPAFNRKIQLCLEETFSILSLLLNNLTDSCNLDLMELVDITIALLNRFLHPDPIEPIYDNRIIVNVVNFIWEVIIRYENVCELFFKRNGVYVMLDILQAYPYPVQLITLGTLVDMCEYSEGKCIPYLITWKGKNGVTLVPLLMEIFRNENKMLGVKSEPNGQIGDTDHPLMGRAQYDQIFVKKNYKISPAVADMFASCRPKIYAILTLMNERYRSILKLANECYKTYNEGQSVHDKMTLLLAENYLGLKCGEAWEEIKYEFEQMEFEPLSVDVSIIESLIERTHKWGRVLKESQEELLYLKKMQDVAQEYKIYNRIQDSRITSCLLSINEAKYIARCTERMFRIAQKFSQIHQVEKAMAKISHGPSLHKTFMKMLPITCVFKQTVRLKSDFKTDERSDSNERTENDYCYVDVPPQAIKTHRQTNDQSGILTISKTAMKSLTSKLEMKTEPVQNSKTDLKLENSNSQEAAGLKLNSNQALKHSKPEAIPKNPKTAVKPQSEMKYLKSKRIHH